MKKQTKVQLANKYISEKSGQIINKIHQRITSAHQIQTQKVLMKQQVFSSPNKQNQLSTSNQIRDIPWSPLSPLIQKLQHSPSSHFCYNSPLKTTSHENIEHFRSNIGKEMLKEQPTSNILFSGFSKDGKYRVESHSLIGEQLTKAVQHERKINLSHILQAQKDREKSKIPIFTPARISGKENGVIKSYAVNTHQGITRSYNEDRVSITLNIRKNGAKAHFFAIYDGHGGSLCCQFLKDTIHQFLINNANFPQDPKKALIEVINLAEQKFSKLARGTNNKQNLPDKSGSCLLVCLVLDEVCYIANVGDSRAILSTEGGKFAFNLSRDHRPTDRKEQERVIRAGGKIYRTEMLPIFDKGRLQKILGPLRIYPGKLSVSRTIGDIEAKQQCFGGIKNIVSSQPQIKKFRLTGKQDFVVMCCDGVLERMESMQVIETAWNALQRDGSMHEKAGYAVDSLMRESMLRRSSDNVTIAKLAELLFTEKEKQSLKIANQLIYILKQFYSLKQTGVKVALSKLISETMQNQYLP